SDRRGRKDLIVVDGVRPSGELDAGGAVPALDLVLIGDVLAHQEQVDELFDGHASLVHGERGTGARGIAYGWELRRLNNRAGAGAGHLACPCATSVEQCLKDRVRLASDGAVRSVDLIGRHDDIGVAITIDVTNGWRIDAFGSTACGCRATVVDERVVGRVVVG